MISAKTRVASIALAAVASLAATTAATPAFAAYEQHSETIRYGDLDLASPAGVSRLNQRIRSAATRVCGVRQARDSGAVAAAFACRKAAIASSADDVDLAIARQRGDSQLASRDEGVIGVSSR